MKPDRTAPSGAVCFDATLRARRWPALAPEATVELKKRPRAVSSAVEHWFYTPLVGSSILSPPTSLRAAALRLGKPATTMARPSTSRSDVGGLSLRRFGWHANEIPRRIARLLMACGVRPVIPLTSSNVFVWASSVDRRSSWNDQRRMTVNDLLVFGQSRQAEYVRLAASPEWARTLGKLSGVSTDSRSMQRCNQCRALS
jgi:hypothetical protein